MATWVHNFHKYFAHYLEYDVPAQYWKWTNYQTNYQHNADIIFMLCLNLKEQFKSFWAGGHWSARIEI